LIYRIAELVPECELPIVPSVVHIESGSSCEFLCRALSERVSGAGSPGVFLSTPAWASTLLQSDRLRV